MPAFKSIVFVVILLKVLMESVSSQDMPPPILEEPMTTTTTAEPPLETSTDTIDSSTTAPETTTESMTTSEPPTTTAAPVAKIYCQYKIFNFWHSFWPGHYCNGLVPTSCYRCCYNLLTNHLIGCQLMAQYYCYSPPVVTPSYHHYNYFHPIPYSQYRFHYNW